MNNPLRPYHNDSLPSECTGDYRFGFQGSEIDSEINGEGNTYSTYYRMLDTRIGRWFSVDPVFQPFQSTFTSMDNNPIQNNDPFGDKVQYEEKATKLLKKISTFLRVLKDRISDSSFRSNHREWRKEDTETTIYKDSRGLENTASPNPVTASRPKDAATPHSHGKFKNYIHFNSRFKGEIVRMNGSMSSIELFGKKEFDSEFSKRTYSKATLEIRGSTNRAHAPGSGSQIQGPGTLIIMHGSSEVYNEELPYLPETTLIRPPINIDVISDYSKRLHIKVHHPNANKNKFAYGLKVTIKRK